MQRWMFLLLLCAGLTALGNAQVQESQPPDNPPKNQAPPRSDRDREALVYKPNDALANFRMGECLEKLKQPEEARVHYEQYLKILPHGPLAPEAEKALRKLGADGRTTRGPDPNN